MSKEFYKAWMANFDTLAKATMGDSQKLMSSAFTNTAIVHNLAPISFRQDIEKFNWESFVKDVQDKFNFRPVGYTTGTKTGLQRPRLFVRDDAILWTKFGTVEYVDSEDNWGSEDADNFSSASVYLDTVDREFSEELYKFVDNYVIEKENLRSVHIIVMEEGCISSLPIDNFKTAPLIRDNYAKNVQDGFDHMVKQLTTDKPNGRLHLLEGEPGTGKSRFISSLMAEAPAKYLFVPISQVAGIGDPSFMGFLLSESERIGEVPLVLILEDSEALLQKRKKVSTGEAAMTSLILNLVDSPLAMGLNLHVISTFNAKLQDFDTAITRAGRLATHIVFPELSYDQANKVYQRETKDETATLKDEKGYSLAEVYKSVNNTNSEFLPGTITSPVTFGVYQ